MPKKKGLPRWNEMVLCTITRITPFAAWCTLDEYEAEDGSQIEGMIHISEVAGKWVKDIRVFVKQNRQYVAKVVRIDYQKGHLNLSLKRVSKFDKKEKMEDYRRLKRAAGIIIQVAKRIGKTEEDAQEITAKLEAVLEKELEEGKKADLFSILEEAKETPAMLSEAGVPKEWADAFKAVMEKSFLVKEKTLRANLSMTSYAPDGVVAIKRILADLETRTGASVKYISAPKYIVDLKSKNLKEGEKKLKEGLEEAIKEIKAASGEGNYKLIKL